MLKYLNEFNGKVIFSVEHDTDPKVLGKIIEKDNVDVIVNHNEPSVLSNAFNSFRYINKTYPDEYFTIFDIDDELESPSDLNLKDPAKIMREFENNFNSFISELRSKNVKLGRFLGPRIDKRIIDPRKYGYYYSTIFHPSIFKYFPLHDYMNPIWGDNYILGYTLRHSPKMIFKRKYFGYVHVKHQNADSSTVSSDSSTFSSNRLIDTLYMNIIEPFGYIPIELPRIIISMATMRGRERVFLQTISSVFKMIGINHCKIIINTMIANEITELLSKTFNSFPCEVIVRQPEIDKGSFNKINLKKSEKKQLILTLDDDMIYDEDLIVNLLNTFISNGHKNIVAGQVRELTSDLYVNCKKVKIMSNEDCLRSVIGCNGVLYPPCFFIDIPKRNPDIFVHCDDLYFSYIAAVKHVKVITANIPVTSTEIIVKTGLFTLAKSNNYKEYSDAIKFIRSQCLHEHSSKCLQ